MNGPKILRQVSIVVTGISFKGVNLDIGHVRHVRWSAESDVDAWVTYNRMRGQHSSALENGVLEYSLNDRTACGGMGQPICASGVSAVQALVIAQAEGQKIYTITQANMSSINNLAVQSETLDTIRDAVSAGKEVTVHEAAISANGWTGAGYVIVDPATGAGAYLIEGKSNGGLFAALLAASILVPMFLFSSGVIGTTMCVFIVLAAAINGIEWIIRVKKANTESEFDRATAVAATSAFASMVFAWIGTNVFGYAAEVGGLSKFSIAEIMATLYEFGLNFMLGP